MSDTSVSTDPAERLGIFKQLDQVPEEYRLRQYADEYVGHNTWEEFLVTHLFDTHDSERFQENARRAGRYWKEHLEGTGRHHALATPMDVETWVAELFESRTLKTVYNSYWVHIEHFYSWLQWHTAHPHVYHPVLIAANSGGVAAKVWDEKMARRRGGANR